MKFRVVDIDNFGGEGPNSTERFITEPIEEDMAITIVRALNDQYGGYGAPRFYRVVPEDYKLFIFEP